MTPVPVADLFAGPGGLGEGFASLTDAFRIELSAECSSSAHRTLRLRAFKRALEASGESTAPYYDYVKGRRSAPWTDATRELWEEAEREALCVTLGNADDDQRFSQALAQRDFVDGVLVGGPPCQAYSLVGRARNRGIEGYVPEDDGRHYLYREYLKLIQHFRPAVFVMENVKGIVSSRVGGRRIFHDILRDLVDPDEALARAPNGPGYRIHSLVDPGVVFSAGEDPAAIPSHAFTVKAEEHGVPQARHRVFLLGVREDLGVVPGCLHKRRATTVADAVGDLPALRSRLSRGDSEQAWRQEVSERGEALVREAARRGQDALAEELDSAVRRIREIRQWSVGARSQPLVSAPETRNVGGLADWWHDPRLDVVLNHETRSHMPADLARYLYAASFARACGRSPRGADDFALPGLAPSHANWTTGKFADRFRVQIEDEPGRTVTSHIAKDGHYYIHPDPGQCRALTVREAARIQTFPDDYFFEGNRTEQYHQVGNAVPPFLARQIAEIVRKILRDWRDGEACTPAREVRAIG